MADVDSTGSSSSSESDRKAELSSLSGTDKPFRRNTIEEKRAMRNTRKKRKRSALRSSREDKEVTQQRLVLAQERLSLEKSFRSKAESETKMFKGMARTYFDRYCWEVQRRKEAMKREKLAGLNTRIQHQCCSKPKDYVFHEISPENLEDPVIDDHQESIYLGRGSFGIVKVQMYRGLKVAVKKFLPRTVREDVKREAYFLAHFCHPHLPLLIGIITASLPYRLVMQFHGVDESGFQATTVWSELKTHQHVPAGSGWLILTCQLMEALQYLHSQAECLHNDIKCDNLLLTKSDLSSVPSSSKADLPAFNFQIVLIDFGKATTIKEQRRLNLTEDEKATYKVRYHHIAPEVVDGITPFTIESDMYAAGNVIQRIHADRRYFNLPEEIQAKITSVMERCLSPIFKHRPSASYILKVIRDIIHT